MEKYSTLIICIVAAMMSVANMIGGTARVIISGAAAGLATLLFVVMIIRIRRGDDET